MLQHGPNGTDFVYSMRTQAPNGRFWRFVSAIYGFGILVCVLWKTGFITTAFRRFWIFAWKALLWTARCLFDRYFDLRRFAEWSLMCISPQLYAAWRTCVYGYIWISGVLRVAKYVLDKVIRILAVFGIRSSSANRLAREISVESLRRAPLGRETSRIASRNR